MNKFVGVLDIVTGIIMVAFTLLINLYVIPKFASLFQQSNIDLSSNLWTGYVSSALLLILGLSNLYVGFKSFKGKVEKFFKWAIALLVVNFILGGVLFYLSVFSTILAIYKLTSSY